MFIMFWDEFCDKMKIKYSELMRRLNKAKQESDDVNYILDTVANDLAVSKDDLVNMMIYDVIIGSEYWCKFSDELMDTKIGEGI